MDTQEAFDLIRKLGNDDISLEEVQAVENLANLNPGMIEIVIDAIRANRKPRSGRQRSGKSSIVPGASANAADLALGETDRDVWADVPQQSGLGLLDDLLNLSKEAQHNTVDAAATVVEAIVASEQQFEQMVIVQAATRLGIPLEGSLEEVATKIRERIAQNKNRVLAYRQRAVAAQSSVMALLQGDDQEGELIEAHAESAA